MARKAIVKEEIPEAKIRQVIWMLKAGKTKKVCCEHLGINYNTKKLDSIIEEFNRKNEREAELKKAAKAKVFSEAEKKSIANAYLNGEAQSNLAKQYYVSPQRIKNILIELNVPLRGRGKNSEGKVDHIIQDLEVKFKKGDKVFIAKNNCFAIVDNVYDEEYIDYLETGRQKYVELYPFKPGKNGLAGKYSEPAQGIHYEIYWLLDDGTEMKLEAMKSIRDKVIKSIEETGREFYRVWREDEFGGFSYVKREELFPIKAQ
jgi:hypothetical protein